MFTVNITRVRPIWPCLSGCKGWNDGPHLFYFAVVIFLLSCMISYNWSNFMQWLVIFNVHIRNKWISYVQLYRMAMFKVPLRGDKIRGPSRICLHLIQVQRYKLNFFSQWNLKNLISKMYLDETLHFSSFSLWYIYTHPHWGYSSPYPTNWNWDFLPKKIQIGIVHWLYLLIGRCLTAWAPTKLVRDNHFQWQKYKNPNSTYYKWGKHPFLRFFFLWFYQLWLCCFL